MRHGNGNRLLVVTGRVSSTGAAQTPGGVVLSEPRVPTFSFPAHSPVCHSYSGLHTPFHLPVTAGSNAFSTEHLPPEVKPVTVVRIQLLSPSDHPCVPLRQRQVSMCCVHVQCELTGVWKKKVTSASFDLQYLMIFLGGHKHKHVEIPLTSLWTWVDSEFSTAIQTVKETWKQFGEELRDLLRCLHTAPTLTLAGCSCSVLRQYGSTLRPA